MGERSRSTNKMFVALGVVAALLGAGAISVVCITVWSWYFNNPFSVGSVKVGVVVPRGYEGFLDVWDRGRNPPGASVVLTADDGSVVTRERLAKSWVSFTVQLDSGEQVPLQDSSNKAKPGAWGYWLAASESRELPALFVGSYEQWFAYRKKRAAELGDRFGPRW